MNMGNLILFCTKIYKMWYIQRDHNLAQWSWYLNIFFKYMFYNIFVEVSGIQIVLKLKGIEFVLYQSDILKCIENGSKLHSNNLNIILNFNVLVHSVLVGQIYSH